MCQFILNGSNARKKNSAVNGKAEIAVVNRLTEKKDGTLFFQSCTSVGGFLCWRKWRRNLVGRSKSRRCVGVFVIE